MFDDTERVGGRVVGVPRLALGKARDAKVKICASRIGTSNANLKHKQSQHCDTV